MPFNTLCMGYIHNSTFCLELLTQLFLFLLILHVKKERKTITKQIHKVKPSYRRVKSVAVVNLKKENLSLVCTNDDCMQSVSREMFP